VIFSETLQESTTYGESYQSENNKWEIALVPRLFGVAVQLNQVGDSGCTATYCCGVDLLSLGLVVQGIKNILKPIPEDAHIQYVRAHFPLEHTKPLTADPDIYQFFEKAACVKPSA